ncbi:MAG TPA: hypothetical protein VFF21_00625 [Flavobacteriaceae bacterium]|nr:hypothetical protein [Flavobacteriaceae bacterium]
MKNLKYLALSILFVMGFGVTHAQQKAMIKKSQVEKRQWTEEKPHHEKWAKELNLSAEQQDKIKDIRSKRAAEKQKLKEEMQKLRDAERQEIREILTPEQQQKMDVQREKRKEKMEKQRKSSKMHHKNQDRRKRK